MSFTSSFAVLGNLTLKAKIILVIVGLFIVGGAGIATRAAIVSIDQQSGFDSDSKRVGDELASSDAPTNTARTDSQSAAKNDGKTSTSTDPKSKTPAKSGNATSSKAPTSSTPGASPSSPSQPPVTGCVGALHMPGGNDGMGGCWPGPHNTGVPAGVSLTNYTGPCTITAANTVIDRKTVNCGLDIQAANVTITNSKINGPIILSSDDCDTNYSYTVTDSEIHVSDINYRGLLYCKYTAKRVEVTGGQSMAWCDTCTIEDSYLHSPLEDPEGAAANHAAHNSTVRMSKFAVIRHNTLWCQVAQYSQPDGQDTSGCSANQTGYSHDGAPPYNSTVEANLYMPTSGGFCAYGGSTTGNLAAVHHIVFKDNIFKRGTMPSDHGEFVCGYYGAVADFDATRPGNQWINNRFDDGTLLLP